MNTQNDTLVALANEYEIIESCIVAWYLKRAEPIVPIISSLYDSIFILKYQLSWKHRIRPHRSRSEYNKNLIKLMKLEPVFHDHIETLVTTYQLLYGDPNLA